MIHQSNYWRIINASIKATKLKGLSKLVQTKKKKHIDKWILICWILLIKSCFINWFDLIVQIISYHEISRIIVISEIKIFVPTTTCLIWIISINYIKFCFLILHIRMRILKSLFWKLLENKPKKKTKLNKKNVKIIIK